MKLNLPNWVQNPLFFGPFFAACLAVPILIGISDRAAEFAGGLTAALAAVIAVVVGGSINRANERAREHRAYASSMRAMALELALYLAIAKTDGSSIAKRLKNYWISPREVGPPNAIWRVMIERSFPPFSRRIEENLWGATEPVAQTVSEVAKLVATLKENVAQESIYPPDKPLDKSRARELAMICENILTLINVAESTVHQYRSEIDTMMQV